MAQFSGVLKLLGAASLCSAMVGCAAVHTAIAKRDLDVQTDMSESVFMDPVDDDEKRIWVQVRNTSVMRDFRIKKDIVTKLREAGYTVVSRKKPYSANYWLQVNTRSVGKMSVTAAEKSRREGPSGALVGTAISYSATYGGNALVSGALAGALVETVANALVADVTYAAIIDVKVSEVSTGQRKAKMRHETRMVATANQVNLEWHEAEDRLESDVAHSIASLFAEDQVELSAR